MKQSAKIIMPAFLAVCILCFSCSVEWVVYRTADYSVQFPQKPDTSTQSVPSQIGELKMEMAMVDAAKKFSTDNLVYNVISTSYPDSLISSDKKEMLPSFFRASIDGSIKNSVSKLLSEKEIAIDGFPGREIRSSVQQGKDIMTMRMYLVHNKMYILQVVTLLSKEKNLSIAKFFNSFVLLKK